MKYYLRPLAKIALTLLLGFLESIPSPDFASLNAKNDFRAAKKFYELS